MEALPTSLEPGAHLHQGEVTSCTCGCHLHTDTGHSEKEKPQQGHEPERKFLKRPCEAHLTQESLPKSWGSGVASKPQTRACTEPWAWGHTAPTEWIRPRQKLLEQSGDTSAPTTPLHGTHPQFVKSYPWSNSLRKKKIFPLNLGPTDRRWETGGPCGCHCGSLIPGGPRGPHFWELLPGRAGYLLSPSKPVLPSRHLDRPPGLRRVQPIPSCPSTKAPTGMALKLAGDASLGEPWCRALLLPPVQTLHSYGARRPGNTSRLPRFPSGDVTTALVLRNV